jgi:hypothetical protein
MNQEQVPDRIRSLPLDVRGFPVPWFVHWDNGVPDFRVVGPGKIADAVRFRRCWTCGEVLGKFMTFVIGPMCLINRISGEPPSHRDCAQYAATHCPFLTRPHMKRNEHKLPEHHEMPGLAVKRNPGVAVLWVSRGYQLFNAPGGGQLFSLGEPAELEFYAEGRLASRQEILHSIETGLPILEEAAALDGDGACAELGRQYKRALALVPK